MSQTYQQLGKTIKAELYQAALDNPDKNKNEIFTIVMKKLDLEEGQRPGVRRSKGSLVKELETILQVLK